MSGVGRGAGGAKTHSRAAWLPGRLVECLKLRVETHTLELAGLDNVCQVSAGERGSALAH